MDSLVGTLFSFAQERSHRVNGPAAQYAARDQEALEQMLEGEAAEVFQRYLDHEAEANGEISIALFRSGLSLGLELGRL